MSANEVHKDLALWFWNLWPSFLFLALPSEGRVCLTCSVFGAVQLVPIPSAEETVELQSGPRMEMNANL